MSIRFSASSGNEKRRTLTVLTAIAIIAAAAAVILLIRMNRWQEKREFGDFIAIVNDENAVRRTWDDFTILDDYTILDSRCADSFERMLADCKAAGGSPICRFSYVSEFRHGELFDAVCEIYKTEYGYTEEQAEEAASRLIGRPGRSEHQLGTSMDIFDASVLKSVIHESAGSLEEYVCEITRKYGIIDAAQRESFTFQWLCEHSWEYGFVLRYPDGSEELTGETANSWHFRYVGELAARQMHELNVTLEEYNTMFYSN